MHSLEWWPNAHTLLQTVGVIHKLKGRPNSLLPAAQNTGDRHDPSAQNTGIATRGGEMLCSLLLRPQAANRPAPRPRLPTSCSPQSAA